MNNIPEYLVEHGHADNMFSAAGMANGLKLAGLTDAPKFMAELRELVGRYTQKS